MVVALLVGGSLNLIIENDWTGGLTTNCSNWQMNEINQVGMTGQVGS